MTVTANVPIQPGTEKIKAKITDPPAPSLRAYMNVNLI